MEAAENSYILYGLRMHTDIIDEIVKKLSAGEQAFEIRLILTEALNNAFCHGNGCDESKPIYLKYSMVNGMMTFEVKDCGPGYPCVTIPENISDTDLFAENGRGLFLIRCYTDEMSLSGNTILMRKGIRR